jgi:hypothetical protein
VLALLSQQNFCLLWVAHTISILGDYVFFIAMTFWIYEQTGSASATGAVLIASTVPSLKSHTITSPTGTKANIIRALVRLDTAT